jgi:hypothetical protein
VIEGELSSPLPSPPRLDCTIDPNSDIEKGLRAATVGFESLLSGRVLEESEGMALVLMLGGLDRCPAGERGGRTMPTICSPMGIVLAVDGFEKILGRFTI